MSTATWQCNPQAVRAHMVLSEGEDVSWVQQGQQCRVPTIVINVIVLLGVECDAMAAVIAEKPNLRSREIKAPDFRVVGLKLRWPRYDVALLCL